MSKGMELQSLKKGDGRLSGPSGEYPIYTEGETSCSLACPAGVDIKAYVNLVADRKYEDAVRVIRRNNPFPGICGRVCTHPCEAECGRKDADGAVSIRALKRFATDYELSRKKPVLAAGITREEKVAVVGSGPAGLTAASDLALAGYHVTVFDESENPGGLLSWGIPDFRLPKNVVRSEIRDIEALGVQIITGKRVDMPGELLKKGYSAVILATGCQRPMLAGIKGEDCDNVIDCLEFLRKVSEGKETNLGKRAVVIGGGNAAMDSARTALRLGAEVTVAYRRTREQMPADPEEIEHGIQEGVKFEFLAIPVEVMPGKSARFQRAELGEPDASGRRSPVPVEGEFLDIPADTVIMAIGSRPDTSPLPKAVKLAKGDSPAIDDYGATTAEGIFAAGDLATGPSTIVDAIGSGHMAAEGVMRFLSGEDATRTGPREMLVVEAPPSESAGRCGTCFIPLEKRQSTFEEAELGMTEREAITEALRCQRCGSCNVCDVCLAVCDYRNAVIRPGHSNEAALAKVPFAVASAAMDRRDGWNIDTGKKAFPVTIEPLLARVDRDRCIACGRCEEACPYRAIRTVFDTSGNAVARVDESACRGCGACIAACPAGAMTFGYLDDNRLQYQVREAVKRCDGNEGIVRLSCVWNTHTDHGERPWEVRVQCTRRVSPAIPVEALAQGARAVAVVGCGRDECHYMPGPWMGPDVVEAARDIIAAVGVNPARIAYIGGMEDIDPFLAGIKGLEPFAPCHDLGLPDTGLGRCMDAAQVLMAQPDIVLKPETGTMLGLGCLGVSEPAFMAYGIGGPDVLEAARKLLALAGTEHSLAGVHTSGERLALLGLDGLQKAYLDSVKAMLREGKAKTLMVPTPRSFEALGKMKLGCKVEPLPLILLKGLEGKLAPRNLTVAYHPACAGGGEWDDLCLELLGRVPGLKVVRAEGFCGDTGWRESGAKHAAEAGAVLAAAGSAGAGILVAGSTRCAAHLRAATAGWSTTPVRVMDIYSFLAADGGEF